VVAPGGPACARAERWRSSVPWRRVVPGCPTAPPRGLVRCGARPGVEAPSHQPRRAAPRLASRRPRVDSGEQGDGGGGGVGGLRGGGGDGGRVGGRRGVGRRVALEDLGGGQAAGNCSREPVARRRMAWEEEEIEDKWARSS